MFEMVALAEKNESLKGTGIFFKNMGKDDGEEGEKTRVYVTRL